MNKPMKEGFVENEPLDDPSLTRAKPEPAEPSEEPVLPEEVPDWPMTIQLRHKPLRKGNEEIKELTFREPSAADIIRSGGNPCRIEITEVAGGQAVYNPVIDDRKMFTLMANLSGVLEPILHKMDPRDYNSCVYRLRRFFLPEQGLW